MRPVQRDERALVNGIATEDDIMVKGDLPGRRLVSSVHQHR